MKNILSKSMAAVVLTVAVCACQNDLNISSIDPQSNASFDVDTLFTKQYATLGLTGQVGPTGNSDLSGDEGEIGFYRTTFNVMELPSDECIWAWQTDQDIPQLTYISWNANSQRTAWVYQRLGVDVLMYNQFLSVTSNDSEENIYRRAEVRFLRALHYWYYLDLFHKAPFKTEFNSELPVPKEGKDLYDWIDNELTEIAPLMRPAGYYVSTGFSSGYGRADRGAAWLLHARLALNSAIYTDKQVNDYNKAILYADSLISSGAYELAKGYKTVTSDKYGSRKYSGYEQLFMADNDENSNAYKEIILPIRQDGLTTRCYSAGCYLVASMRCPEMPFANTSAYWTSNFARASLVEKFFDKAEDCPCSTESAPNNSTESQIISLDESDGSSTAQIIAAAGDDRALFYAGRGGGVRKVRTDKITTFTDGLSIVKWQNLRSDGKDTQVHDAALAWPDTDIPLLRFAEAYMIKAEAAYRLNDKQTAISNINVLRERAHTSNISTVNDKTMLDEWSREFYMEGRRRSDLVRFNAFTSSSYLWDWKGGEANGKAVDSKFNVYPIPYDDINNNPNMSDAQNEGY